MSQSSKIYNQLVKNTQTPGITAAKLSKLTRVPKSSVYKRIHDLRVNEGCRIYSNYRLVNGEKKMYYRIAE